MKKSSLLVLAACTLLLATCGKKGGIAGLQVPKDAAFVLHINSASISSKISWKDISETSWFKEAGAKEKDSLAQKLMADPASSGIDTKQDFVLFMKKHGNGSYMVAEGSLSSEAAYQQMLANMTKKEPKEIKKSGDFSYMVSNDKTVVLWNKSKFALVTNGDMPAMPKVPGVGGLMRNHEYSESTRFETDSLLIFGQQALSTEGGNDLGSDSRFADLVKNGSDVHMWVNMEQLYSGVNQLNKMLPMVRTEDLFKGSVATVSINFDNGKITATSKHYPSDAMKKIAEKNKPQAVSAATINRIPSSNVVMVFAFNYSPTGLNEVLKLTGLDGPADIALSKMGFSIDDFIKANKGEVLFAMSDPVSRQEIDSDKVNGTMPTGPFSKIGANVLFASSVNDQAAFQKQVDLISGLMGGLKQKFDKGGDAAPANPIIPGITYKIQNNWFALSNSSDHTDKFLAGGNSNVPFADKITGKPVGIYIDLQKLSNWMHSRYMKDNAPSIWQDIVATGGEFNGTSSEFNIEINLVDKNTNALKQINQQVDKAFIKNKERMSSWENHSMMGMDSVAVPGEKH